MNALGYAFMALGNHDFEYTADRTRELQSLAHFPMRAANAIVTATGAPFLGDPTLVVNAGGVRVGLLALGYHNTDQTGNKDNTRGLSFTSGIEAARAYGACTARASGRHRRRVASGDGGGQHAGGPGARHRHHRRRPLARSHHTAAASGEARG